MSQALRSSRATAIGSLLGGVILLVLVTAANSGVRAYRDYHAKEPEFFLEQSVRITRGFYRSHDAKIIYWDRWSDTYTVEIERGTIKHRFDELPPHFMEASPL